jgi:GABA permease
MLLSAALAAVVVAVGVWRYRKGGPAKAEPAAGSRDLPAKTGPAS